MTSEVFLIVYVLFFLIQFIWEQLLTILNLRELKRNKAVPPAFLDGTIDNETYRRTIAYTREKSYFGLLSAAFSSIVVLALILTGILGALDSWLKSFQLSQYIHGVLYIFGVSFFFQIIGLPWSIYNQFVIEERYGFNKMTGGLFFFDKIKGTLLSGILLAIILLGLFWFLDMTGSWWWIWAFSFVLLFQLIMSFLYPMIIAPLFNKFEPLQEGDLKEAIQQLCKNQDFSLSGVFIMDGSKRSSHSNAYFTGFGKARRIVLYDTLVESMTHKEIVAVLAHEIGHFKKRHIVKNLAMSSILLLAAMKIIDFLLSFTPMYEAFGFSNYWYHATFVIFAFCAGPFTFFFSPLFSMLSRVFEYQADRFASIAVGTTTSLKTALIKLSKDNLSNLTPHKLYSFYHYSHPTLSERLSALAELEKKDKN